MDMPTTKIAASEVCEGMVLMAGVGGRKIPSKVTKVEVEGVRRRIHFDNGIYHFVDSMALFDRTVNDRIEPFNWSEFEQSKNESNRGRFAAIMTDFRCNEATVIEPIADSDDRVYAWFKLSQRAFDLLEEAGIIKQ